jgi:inhibitor of cysteine peptidase
MAERAGALVLVALLVGSAVGAGVTLSTMGPASPQASSEQPPADGQVQDPSEGAASNLIGELSSSQAAVGTFANESDFRSYVREGSRLADSDRIRTRRAAPRRTDVVEEEDAVPQSADTARGDGGDGGDAGGGGGAASGGGGSAPPSRIANTNVQVQSLDEPDIVKTDGRNFYYAPEPRAPRPVERDVVGGDGVAPPRPRQQPQTNVIDASEPTDPEVLSAINTSGRLLQVGETLVVFRGDRVVGYDVSDPSDPAQTWEKPLNGSVVTARQQSDTIYLVTETRVDVESPCPIEPMGPASTVPCTEVYRPGTQVPVDSTYSAFSIEAASGSVQDSVSFVGTSRNTVVYMSPDALYVTYTKPTSEAALAGEFLREEFDRTPDRVADRIAEIQSYDISAQSKEREMQRAFRRWTATLPEEEQRTVQQSFREEFTDYVDRHQRNISQTGIVRVDVQQSNLSVEATGTVPGEPLNQFSMDQHDGTLRITTTIPQVRRADSENDLYVLDSETLDQRGSVTGMGVTERVYSVRYVGDTAYVVTFRRIDPFHVVDLSEPEDPEEVGELKLPGFSSYLHPVDDDHVLGIGEEDGRVKAVLFDVSDPADPTIADDMVLRQRWSAVSESHHAFLMDRKHGVFVLPANRNSLVVDYTNESLSIETTISTAESATRARYVEDSLYVFAGDSITVVDELTWETITTLDLDE